ncbi:MAG: double-strand break repair helicase AddA [Rhodospirillales bacterium]|nr:double-strand break repair helicase AddA [Rhodospirillales bacterium]
MGGGGGASAPAGGVAEDAAPAAAPPPDPIAVAHAPDAPPPRPSPARGEGESSPRVRANRAQLDASDPGVSAFVAASAGSGKTKLLTDRLLRLMLAGAQPERIQCLTFTKAAASEMALRLQRTLGRWVTLADAALDEELRRLQVEPTDDTRMRARALFATVLDLPGGMRIGTIHAFCQSLLRRFPLEAALSPHFQLVDDRDAEDALAEAREDMLATANTPALRAALERLAGLATADQFGRHVAALQADRQRLAGALALGPALEAAQRRALGVDAASGAEIVAAAVNWQAEPNLREAARRVQAQGAPKVAERAAEILGWLSLPAEDRAAHWDAWRTCFFTQAGVVRGDTAFVNAKLDKTDPDLLPAFQAEAARIEEADDRCRALELAAISAALVTLAAPVLQAYARHKQATGLVDYDDLIGRTSDLLVDPGAAWVLYKLDGGLDHLLLDEVQDTAPAQWKIAHALTAEFFAGAGASDAVRTVFAVGDRKQSIYSFQGADAEEFDRSRALLRTRVERAGQPWRDTGLDVSFRSTAPVLALVDAVFAQPAAGDGVVEAGERLTHYSDRVLQAGRVELWPLTPLPDATPLEPWQVPEQNQGLRSAPQHLAETLADWIRDQTGGGVRLESKGRPLAPGDVMVLVRRRNAFAHALVRALKTRGVPVAGLDRLVLTEPPAVQDLLALCDALLLPQDDLTFACLLTSPLGGLTDDDLMDLAIGRAGPLWETLRDRAAERAHWDAAWRFFAALLARVDYVSPYALLVEALGPLGGRARLFARLGAEAAEPIDELLQAALTYGRLHPPSLQGFLHWLRRSGAEVKREPDAAGNLVRVMTVHGAKGLQAPLVILPDTTALPPDEGTLLWAEDPASRPAPDGPPQVPSRPMVPPLVPLWAPRKEFRCIAAQRLRDDLKRKRMQEHNRLLYVALTRAEDRLLVCGWQTRRGPDPACWYNLIAGGFAALGAEPVPFDPWEGEVLSHATGQTGPIERGALVAPTEPPPPPPSWLGSDPGWRAAPPPAEPPRPLPLAPSRPEGVADGSVPQAASPLAARDGGDRFRRGQAIHALLQHLPAVPSPDRAGAARRWLARPGQGIAPETVEEVVAEVLAILDHPELAPLFGPEGRAEMPLTGLIGDAVVGGLVDRLAVLPDRVLVADYKTNRVPPDSVAATPVLYLRQMASYRAVLRAIFPDRPVRCALVWTRSAEVVMLPDDVLDPHAPGGLEIRGSDPSHAPAAD